MSALFPARKRLGSMAILEQKRQAVDAASRALCFVRRRRPCVRSSDPRRISALDSPSIRGTRNQNSKARTRFSWPGWACGTDLTTSRDFYETQNIHSSPNLSGKPSPPNQIKQENSATAVLCEGVSLPHQPNGCIVTVPPGSSRDLTAGDAHPGVPCRSSHCSPAPGWTGARRGGSLSTRASRVSPAPLSSAELLSPWFPTLLLPPTTPWPYYVLPREGEERLAIFPNISPRHRIPWGKSARNYESFFPRNVERNLWEIFSSTSRFFDPPVALPPRVFFFFFFFSQGGPVEVRAT